MVKSLTLFFLLTLSTLIGQEIALESDYAHYDGSLIILTGNVSLTNTLGKVVAKEATLKKDEKHQTTIDFPWIELKEDVRIHLAEGGILECDTLLIDYTQMTCSFFGSPQVTYKDVLGEIYADKALIDYSEVEGTLVVTKVTLRGNVQLAKLQPTSQYALADVVVYFPSEQLALLEGHERPVLFYDTAHDMQLSAWLVRAQKDPLTQIENVKGEGDVRFIFGPEEFVKIKSHIKK